MKLSELSHIVDATLQGEDKVFTEVSINSRTIQPEELFVALKGENFDGHDFVSDAAVKGASAAIVNRPLNTKLPLLIVEDTLQALTQLAQYKWQTHKVHALILTGSCGKTTVKEMSAAILAECGSVLASRGNFNNHIGLPLNLTRLTTKHRFAVIEMGANHAGEIANLTRLVSAEVALITNIGPAHLAGFGSIEGVARAKAEIFQGLTGDGVGVINADSQFANQLRQQLAGHRVISFALENPADYYARELVADEEGCYRFVLHTPGGYITIQLPLPGKHNVINAVAAAAATQALTAAVSLEKIKAGLEKVRPVTGRLMIRQGIKGTRILDDSYNANLSSVTAGLEALAHYPGERILVLGDLGELGEAAPAHHQEIGHIAKKLGINHLYACGKLTALTIDSFGKDGYFFATQAELINALKQILTANMTLLIKGSRSSKMETVVAALVKE